MPATDARGSAPSVCWGQSIVMWNGTSHVESTSRVQSVSAGTWISPMLTRPSGTEPKFCSDSFCSSLR